MPFPRGGAPLLVSLGALLSRFAGLPRAAHGHARDPNRILSRVTGRHQGLKIFSTSIIRVAALNTAIYIQRYTHMRERARVRARFALAAARAYTYV